MNCSKCNHAAALDQKFCSACGSSLNKCPNCGNDCLSEDKFCGRCGAKLEVDSEVSSTPSSTSPPIEISLLLPAVEKIEGGLRKHATVLFADIKGSTSLIEGLDPEEARNISLPIIKEMLNAVYRYNGSVIHTAGDGIVVAFGAPQSVEDHALRACFAALAMQEQTKVVNAQIQIRVGINSGEILLEVVGDHQHLEYDIAGPVVNLAARMEQTAKGGTIQITKDTLKLVEKSAQVVSLGGIQVKGFQELIDTYELKSIHESKSDVKRRQNLMPFVSREKEMSTLVQQLNQAKSGQGNVVALCADPGQGKSRLIYEFIHSDAAKDCQLLFTGGFSHTSNVPLLPIIDLFKSLLTVEKGDDRARIESEIQPHLESINFPYARSAIFALLGMTVDDSEWNKLPPQVKQKHMLEVGTQILFNLGKKQPLVLLIEDLHWIDAITQSFLDLLFSSISHSSIFLLLSYRPEYINPWLTQPNQMQILLKPLEQGGEEMLLDALLGQDPSLSEIKRKLITGCRGNPFFIEEMVKSLVSDKILIGEPQNYQLNATGLVKSIQLPETIYAVLQTQIDQLDQEQKKVLQLASVIGQQFAYSLTSQVAGINEMRLRRVLNELSDKQLIEEMQLQHEPFFTFKHALIQEVVYGGMLKTSRRAMHLKIMTQLEKGSLEESYHVQLIANHAFMGENWTKAFNYCKEAATRSFWINALDSSLQFYSKAVTAAGHLEKNQELVKNLAGIYFEMIQIFSRVGQYEKQLPLLDVVMQLATETQNKALECDVVSWYNMHYIGLRQPKKGEEYGKKGYALAKEIGDRDSLLFAQLVLVHGYSTLGYYKQVVQYGNELLEIIPDLTYHPIAHRFPSGYLTIFYQAVADSFLGDFADLERMQSLVKSVDCENSSVPALLASAIKAMSYIFQGKGDANQAIQDLLHSVIYSFDVNMRVSLPYYAGWLALLYIRQGNLAEGKKYLDLAMTVIKELQLRFVTNIGAGAICEGLMLLGESEEARKLTDEFLAIGNEACYEGLKVYLLRVSAEINLRLPNPDWVAIKGQLEEALKLGAQLEMIPESGHAHFALAKLYEQMGKWEEREKELELTLEIYKRLDMSYWIALCNSFNRSVVK